MPAEETLCWPAIPNLKRLPKVAGNRPFASHLAGLNLNDRKTEEVLKTLILLGFIGE